MPTTIEFASPEWLEALKELIASYSAQAGGTVEFSVCEVFTNVPKHLDKHRNGTIAWYCRINGRRIEFEEGEIADADIKTVADYDFILSLARMKIEPATMDEYARKSAEGAASGKLTQSGNRSKIPPAFYGMHNDLAEITR